MNHLPNDTAERDPWACFSPCPEPTAACCVVLPSACGGGGDSAYGGDEGARIGSAGHVLKAIVDEFAAAVAQAHVAMSSTLDDIEDRVLSNAAANRIDRAQRVQPGVHYQTLRVSAKRR